MRLHNAAIKRERHITPTLDEIITDLTGSKVFSKIDLNAGDHQVKMHRDSSDKQEHMRCLEMVLSRLVAAGLTIHREKYEFMKDEIIFFGYMFNGAGVSADPQKVADIKEASPPTSPTEVCSFLGIVMYCRRFNPNLATMSEPLRELTKSNIKWTWGPNCQEAFEQIKTSLSADTTMAYCGNGTMAKELYVDGSPVGLGAILVQVAPTGETKPIAYMSCALTPTEQRYSHIENEAIAVLWGYRHFNIYLYGGKFKAYMDHMPLIPIFTGSSSHPPARIGKWLLHLQQYKFELIYQPGTSNPADFLSRHPRAAKPREVNVAEETEEHICQVVHMMKPRAISIKDIIQATQADACCDLVKDFIISSEWKSFLRNPHDDICQLRMPSVTGSTSNGDVLIGGIFPIHADRVYPVVSSVPFREAPAPITCQVFSVQNYQWLRAMTFAIQEINQAPNLLPNITLGFWIYDSCTMRQRALQGTLWMLSGQQEPVPNYQCRQKPPLAGIVGDAGSSNSLLMARLLGLYRVPQVSYFSTSPLLSDRHQFPSFFRTIPSDDFQSRGLAKLILHFGWTWVGLLADDNDYGQLGIQAIKLELLKSGACIAFSENIILSQADRNAFHIVQVIINTTANAIVIFSLDAGLVPLLDELVQQNVTGKMWIASEAWSTSVLFSMEKYMHLLEGTVGFAVHHGEIPGFQEYFTSINPAKSPDDIFIRELWEDVFRCQWMGRASSDVSLWQNKTKLCTDMETLNRLLSLYDETNLRISYNTYSAVNAFALALHNLSSCKPGSGPFHQWTCADIQYLKPWQVFHYIENSRFHTKDAREMLIDDNRSPLAQYDIINWQRSKQGSLRLMKVGDYNSRAPPGETLTVNASAIQWPEDKTKIPVSVCTPSCSPGFRKEAKQGKPLCCFQCVACPAGEISNKSDSTECVRCASDHWPNVRHEKCIPKAIQFLSFEEALGVVLAAASLFCSGIPPTILGLFIFHRDTPIVKANNRSLSYLLLLSLTLCFLCSLVFIGYPTPEKCLIRQAAFGITFTLCVSCILAKTIMVVIAFNATKPKSGLRKWMGPQLSYNVISGCTLIQVLLCTAWMIISPPFTEYNTHTQPGKILVECNEGSPIAFWCMLGYLWILAIISFIVAFLARKLPDSFNEAKLITFSMLAFLSVWLTFVPAYLSTRDKFMVAMEIFAILASSSALLCCIFFPKCYIIVLKPKANHKKHVFSGKRSLG
ncbi:vomeronasal type-2 receptor 1-like [Ambystoma mexicanum]|uniref:vomeronasal type-2 receptor 1-like n=1 Tax=Ambystoma mexicanum TaxID=8296 RepID=UPI0037E9AF69